MRSPACQRRRWSRSKKLCEGRTGTVDRDSDSGSLMAAFLQTQLGHDEIDRSGQAFAQGFRAATDLGSNGSPVQTLVTEVQEMPFVGRETAAGLGQQILEGDPLARRSFSGSNGLVGQFIEGNTAVGMALDAGPARLVGQFVASHDSQQFQEILRPIQFVLSQGRTHEKTGQDRLADILSVEQTPEPGIHEPDVDDVAQRGLIAAQQFHGRGFIALPDALQQLLEREIVSHEKFSDSPRGSSIPFMIHLRSRLSKECLGCQSFAFGVNQERRVGGWPLSSGWGMGAQRCSAALPTLLCGISQNRVLMCPARLCKKPLNGNNQSDLQSDSSWKIA